VLQVKTSWDRQTTKPPSLASTFNTRVCWSIYCTS